MSQSLHFVNRHQFPAKAHLVYPGREQGCRHCLEKNDKKGKEDEVDPAVM